MQPHPRSSCPWSRRRRDCPWNLSLACSLQLSSQNLVYCQKPSCHPIKYVERIGCNFDCCVCARLTKAERRSSSSNVTALSFFLAAIDGGSRCLLGNSPSADLAWSPNCTCKFREEMMKQRGVFLQVQMISTFFCLTWGSLPDLSDPFLFLLIASSSEKSSPWELIWMNI